MSTGVKYSALPVLLSLMTILAFLVACGDTQAPTEAPVVPPEATATSEPDPEPQDGVASEESPTETPVPYSTAQEETPPPPAAETGTKTTEESSAQPTSEPSPEPTVIPYPSVPGIVDPSNHGWPRDVETSEGRITLDAPPQAILTYSLGHDEILVALVGSERIAAIGKFASNPAYSNIVEIAESLPVFEKGAENVIAARPDLFVVSAYTQQDIVDLVKDAGIPVVRPALEDSAEGNIPNILLMGYMFGSEERALELVAEIQDRLQIIEDRVPGVDSGERPAVISISRYSDSISVSGGGTSGSGIIEAAGGINAAARDGIDGFQTISVESIAAMNPDFIFIPQDAESGGNKLREDLMGDPVLATVPAIANSAIHVVDAANYITLSHWNVRGIERTAEILFPDSFSDVTFSDFAPYTGE